MADPIDLAPPVMAIGLDPKEAIEFFRSKGYAPPESRFSYRDWYGASHARGFVVAKVMQDDLLATVYGATDETLAEGKTLEHFSEILTPKLKAAGWWGEQTMRDPLTGEMRTVQLGSRRRLAVIFDTNLRTSYAAGKWVRIQRTRELLPYLLYTQLQRPNKREAHTRFHRLVLPADHPLWATHYPPNGYYCACTVRQMSRAMLENEGIAVSAEPQIKYKTWTDPRTGRRLRVPEGITPGFDNNPGATFLADQGRHDQIAGDLTPEARGVELGLIHEARSRGIRTGNRHLAAIDSDTPSGWIDAGSQRPLPDDALKARLADSAARIALIRNQPASQGLSSADLQDLETWPGLSRTVAVAHDGSLHRASLRAETPQPGIAAAAASLLNIARQKIRSMSEPGTDDRVIETLAILAAARALDRAGLIDYAWTLAGGSKLMLDNFGTSRMDSLVAEMAASLTP